MSPESMELLADTVQYVAVCFIGAFIGIGELISRYKDDPFKAIANQHAVTYTLVNVLAAAMALLALKTLPYSIGITGGTGEASVAAQRIGQALTAGFGAMAILRSSAFVVRVGEQDVAIGPSALLQVILSATDRAVDRARARVRAEQVAKTMHAIPFSQVEETLPMLAFSMLQNLSAGEKEEFARDLAQIRQSGVDERAKSICLGLALTNHVGQDVLDAAVEALRNSLKLGGDPEKAAPMKLLGDLLPGKPEVGAAETPVSPPPDNK